MSVYFVQCDESGPIKIGMANDPRARVSSLQTANPYPLHLRAIAVGGRERERQYHEAFSDYHIRGEWFFPASALQFEIEIVDAMSGIENDLLDMQEAIADEQGKREWEELPGSTKDDVRQKLELIAADLRAIRPEKFPEVI